MKLVRDYMRKEVVCFKPNDSIFTVAEKLIRNHISGGPVVDNEKRVIGVISETDIVKFMRISVPETGPTSEPHLLTILLAGLIKGHIELKKKLEKLSEIEVKDLMSDDVVSISSDQPILEAATIMCKNKVNRLPVIDNGKLVGVITRADLIRALIE